MCYLLRSEVMLRCAVLLKYTVAKVFNIGKRGPLPYDIVSTRTTTGKISPSLNLRLGLRSTLMNLLRRDEWLVMLMPAHQLIHLHVLTPPVAHPYG